MIYFEMDEWGELTIWTDEADNETYIYDQLNAEQSFNI